MFRVLRLQKNWVVRNLGFEFEKKKFYLDWCGSKRVLKVGVSGPVRSYWLDVFNTLAVYFHETRSKQQWLLSSISKKQRISDNIVSKTKPQTLSLRIDSITQLNLFVMQKKDNRRKSLHILTKDFIDKIG